MPQINLYFQVHQPYRLNEYTFFDIGSNIDYFNNELNQEILDKVSKNCYLPTYKILLKLIEQHEGRFKFSFSFSGVFLEQLELWQPAVLESFQKLTRTGCVEILSETYYHSLSSIYDINEFNEQIQKHKILIKRLFDQTPTTLRNTELIFHKELLPYCCDKGYKNILAEGTESVLGYNLPYQALVSTENNTKILCRDFELSDEIAYRFSNKDHELYPLTNAKFNKLLPEQAALINLYMDYETFGEHHWANTGIFKFLEKFPKSILEMRNFSFSKVSEANTQNPLITEIKDVSSWADKDKNLSAWLGNNLQKDAFSLIYEMKEKILASGNENLIDTWRKLQTSDHLYYMSTKHSEDGEVHSYFSPYRSPYDAYLYFTNVLKDLKLKIN